MITIIQWLYKLIPSNTKLNISKDKCNKTLTVIIIPHWQLYCRFSAPITFPVLSTVTSTVVLSLSLVRGSSSNTHVQQLRCSRVSAMYITIWKLTYLNHKCRCLLAGASTGQCIPLSTPTWLTTNSNLSVTRLWCRQQRSAQITNLLVDFTVKQLNICIHDDISTS